MMVETKQSFPKEHLILDGQQTSKSHYYDIMDWNGGGRERRKCLVKAQTWIVFRGDYQSGESLQS